MDVIEKSKKVAKLLKEVEADKEHINRIKELNKYDHENSGGTYEQFSIKFCGSNAHTYLYIRDNDLGDSIEVFFTDLIQLRIDKAESELSNLLAP